MPGSRASVTLSEDRDQGIVYGTEEGPSDPFGLRLGQERQRVPPPVRINGDLRIEPASVVESVELVDPGRDVPSRRALVISLESLPDVRRPGPGVELERVRGVAGVGFLVMGVLVG